MEVVEGFGGSDLFGFWGKEKYEANVGLLLRDLDHNGHISPYAASSKTANEFRLTGCSEHETALGLCLTQAIALFATGKMIEAISLISSAEEKARVWVEARVVRVELANDFFRDVETGINSLLIASATLSEQTKDTQSGDRVEASISQRQERKISPDSAVTMPEKTIDAFVQIDLNFYPRASRIIEYSTEASAVWQKVQSLPDAFQLEFLETLEAQPSQKVSVLYGRLAAAAEKFLRPYASDSANEALYLAREISPAAEREFREVYELLQRPDNVDEILRRVRDKFEKLTRAEYDIIRRGLSYGDIQTAADKIRRFGYVAKSNGNKRNLGGVFTFPDGHTERYHNNSGLVSLIRVALNKIKADNLVE